jgi:8-oxo-dGTP diphosphatase
VRARVAVAVAVLGVENGELKVGLHKEVGKGSVLLSLPTAIAGDGDGLDLLARRLAGTVVTNEIAVLQQTGAYLVRGEGSQGPTVVVGYRGICRGTPTTGKGTVCDLGSVPHLREETKNESSQKAKAKLLVPHDQVLWTTLTWLYGELGSSPLAMEFCERRFTITDLRKVFEAVWEAELDASNFQRKITNKKLGLVRVVKKSSGMGPRTISALYERGTGNGIHPPIRRPAPKKRAKGRKRSVWAVPWPDEWLKEWPDDSDRPAPRRRTTQARNDF